MQFPRARRSIPRGHRIWKMEPTLSPPLVIRGRARVGVDSQKGRGKSDGSNFVPTLSRLYPADSHPPALRGVGVLGEGEKIPNAIALGVTAAGQVCTSCRF